MRDLDRRAKPWCATAALALTIGVLAATAATADYRDHFRDGVKAYDEKRWAQSVAAMNRALAERPHADNYKVTVFSSLRISYVPNTFLGIALAKLGRCDEAIQAVERAEAQGVAARSARKYFREALDEANACRQKLMQGSISEVQEKMTAVRDIADQVEESTKSGVGAKVLAETSSLGSRIEEARQLERAATERLSLGVQGNSLTTVREAADLADRAQTEWATVRRDLNIKIASADIAPEPPPPADAAPARRALEAAKQARARAAERLRASGAEAPLRRNPGIRNRWQESGRRLEQLETALTNAASAQDQAALDQVATTGQRLAQAFTRLDQEIAAEVERRRAQAAAAKPAATSTTQSATPQQETPEPQLEEPAAESPTPTGGATSSDSEPPARTAEQRLADGAGRYFAGDYAGAAEILKSFSFSSRPELDAQRQLLLAASQFAYARTLDAEDGTGGQALVDAARGLLTDLLAERPELEISEIFFSPAFRQFAAATRDR